MSARALDHVPCSVIAPLIKKWMEDYSIAHQEQFHGNKYFEANEFREGSLSVLGDHCGISARHLRRIAAGKVEQGTSRNGVRVKLFVDYISFDQADKIVCATAGPLAWHDEPLKQFYGPFTVTAAEIAGGYELPDGTELTDVQERKWRKAVLRSLREMAA